MSWASIVPVLKDCSWCRLFIVDSGIWKSITLAYKCPQTYLALIMATRGIGQEAKHEIQATAVASSGLYHSLAFKSVFHVPQVYCCSGVAYIHDDCWTTIGMKQTSSTFVLQIETFRLIRGPILCLAARQLCLRHKVHFFLPCATSFRGSK